MDEIRVYLQLGFHHIADLAGYDHILFIAALAIPYAPRDWRRLALLVTAFTVGHSITLALATMRLLAVRTSLVETLIPLTIVVTAALALVEQRRADEHAAPASPGARYTLALGFGLIHGLGFATYLRALLGAEERIALPLLAFNVGLEIGQLFVLSIVLAVGTLVVKLVLGRRRWEQLLATATGALASVLLVQRLRGGA